VRRLISSLALALLLAPEAHSSIADCHARIRVLLGVAEMLNPEQNLHFANQKKVPVAAPEGIDLSKGSKFYRLGGRWNANRIYAVVPESKDESPYVLKEFSSDRVRETEMGGYAFLQMVLLNNNDKAFKVPFVLRTENPNVVRMALVQGQNLYKILESKIVDPKRKLILKELYLERMREFHLRLQALPGAVQLLEEAFDEFGLPIFEFIYTDERGRAVEIGLHSAQIVVDSQTLGMTIVDPW